MKLSAESKSNIAAIIIIIILGALWLILPKKSLPGTKAEPIACTQEAKICPDGTALGRSGPNCEFPLCPPAKNPITSPSTTPSTPTPPPTTNSGIQGTVTIGPSCPVQRIPPDPACEDKPYQAVIKVKTAEGLKEVTQFTSGSDGKFKVSLNAGSYLLEPQSGGVFPTAQAQVVKVEKNKFTIVNIVFDSGIR